MYPTFSYRITDTPYILLMTPFPPYLRPGLLAYLLQQADLDLRKEVHDGYGAVIPNAYTKQEISATLPRRTLFAWFNQCQERYVSYETLVTIVGAIKNAVTVPGYMPAEWRTARWLFILSREMEGGEQLMMGDGVIWGQTDGT